MAQTSRLMHPAEDDVRILGTPHAGEGHRWDVFFGRSSTPMHSTSKETARRAARQHARGHQVAVWHIIKDHPDSRELLYDHRRADNKKSDK